MLANRAHFIRNHKHVILWESKKVPAINHTTAKQLGDSSPEATVLNPRVIVEEVRVVRVEGGNDLLDLEAGRGKHIAQQVARVVEGMLGRAPRSPPEIPEAAAAVARAQEQPATRAKQPVHVFEILPRLIEMTQ